MAHVLGIVVNKAVEAWLKNPRRKLPKCPKEKENADSVIVSDGNVTDMTDTAVQCDLQETFQSQEIESVLKSTRSTEHNRGIRQE